VGYFKERSRYSLRELRKVTGIDQETLRGFTMEITHPCETHVVRKKISSFLTVLFQLPLEQSEETNEKAQKGQSSPEKGAKIFRFRFSRVRDLHPDNL
jgi:predicted transcriptional regulator